MLPTNSQTDPIVEILRLAYRRGLAIREKRAGQNQIVKSTNSGKSMKEAEEQPTSTKGNRSESS